MTIPEKTPKLRKTFAQIRQSERERVAQSLQQHYEQHLAVLAEEINVLNDALLTLRQELHAAHGSRVYKLSRFLERLFK